MGNDYQLKKIYEQMLKGTTEKSSGDKPKSLNEAYKQILTEKTAYFSRTMDPGQDATSYAKSLDPKLELVGSIEKPDEVKVVNNAIKSHAVVDLTTNLLTNAGWPISNPVLNVRNLGQLLFDCDIEKEDITKIVENKSKLNAISPSKLTSRFPITEKIIEGLKTVIPDIDSNKTKTGNFNNLISQLFEITGTDKGGTTIGPGELLLSLLTDATKLSEKGDLDFNGKRVELKGSKISTSTTKKKKKKKK